MYSKDNTVSKILEDYLKEERELEMRIDEW